MNRTRTIAGAAALLALLVLAANATALDEGRQAPDFVAAASLDGQAVEFSLQEALADGPVVVYFFPAAFTRGCDIEAHAFASHHERFAEAGATIIGVSADPVDKLNEFSADPDFCAGKFAVASDLDGSIGKRYGLELREVPEGATDSRGQPLSHGVLPRVTFVLDSSGRVIARLSSDEDGIAPQQHASKALEIVEGLADSAT
ncbi:MAG TPA: peroxiredoxin [Wenzhouxiangella sp.]|nr:peroxiredoxin [Wenzhouxiangella sp.]